MSKARRGSVNFITMSPGVVSDSSDNNSTDDIQIALAPHIQTYLSQAGRRHSCCSVMLPVPFERAASQSWLDPRFDSAVLEGQFRTSVFPHIRMRYRFALAYILLCSLVWFLYFLVDGGSEHFWRPISSAFSMLSIVSVIGICFTHWDVYRANTTSVSALTAIVLSATSLIFLACTGRAFSPLGHFAICLEILLLIYTALPMPLWMCAVIALVYSVAFELASHAVAGNSAAVHGASVGAGFSGKIVALRILLHCCAHLIGVHILIMNMVRMRGTFMKVGQNLLVRRQLEMEKQLKEKMIHSVMPPKVADILLKEGVDGSVGAASMRHEVTYTRPRTSNDVKSLFRPFHMHSMPNVSILFADIVGFTRMASTKTAEQLVEILNDLFERFDDLCCFSGCEKISTLGDCYYCVSGCPEPRPDHAVCCVEMGLGMIDAMRCFDAQRHEGVKMRVGVHTGSVLCGIVGTRRVKFDVWSNDVTLANKMESSGKPEQVHISETTASFLNDAYNLEEGEEAFGHRTYFVVGRRRDISVARPSGPHITTHKKSSTKPRQCTGCSLSHSATNISGTQLVQIPVGQMSTSLNPSPILSLRPRLTSISVKLRKKSRGRERDVECGIMHPAVGDVPPVIVVRDRPKIIITTKSLPSSLDSAENSVYDHSTSRIHDDVATSCTNGIVAVNAINGLATTDIGNTTRSKIRLKSWKVPCFTSLLDGRSQKISVGSSADSSANKRPPATLIFNNNAPGQCNGLNENIPTNETVSKGYQQIPVVIETMPSPISFGPPSPSAIGCPPYQYTSTQIKAVSRSPDGVSTTGCDGCCNSGQQCCLFDEIIDVRSYISQSRSDISPFGRSSSYRSQCGRASSQVEISRPRAATLTTEAVPCTAPNAVINIANCATIENNNDSGGINHFVNGTMNSGNSNNWPENMSLCASATSRKDSGIKSNSRRSSIQHQIYALNQSAAINQHRVSGYFTSSASSISNNAECIPASTLGVVTQPQGTAQPITHSSSQIIDPLSPCFQQLRKQSDLQLIRCLRDNAKSQRSYLVKPPLRRFSLYFKSDELESEFRSKAHRFGNEQETDGPPTLATPRYNTYIDIFVGITVYLAVSVALFLLTPNTVTPSFRCWICLFAVFTGIQVLVLFLFTRQMCLRHGLRNQYHLKADKDGNQQVERGSCLDRMFEGISNWLPWHVCLAILMAMPVLLIIANFLLLDLNQLEAFEYHYGFLIFVCIVHFCNFTQLNCWMRNVLALLAALSFVGIAVSQLTVYANRSESSDVAAALSALQPLLSGERLDGSANKMSLVGGDETFNATKIQESIRLGSREITRYLIEEIKWFQDYHVEIYLDLILILVLVWILNREFEIGYRLTFYGNAVANQDKLRVQNMKNQADMLLHNIIPKHVAEHLKNTAKYSENHLDVGIIFASIINFNEMYDESYLGGKEYLRVLNELIGDFDELLSRPEFRSVEKIKTIGSTFMAASGLDPLVRGMGRNEHLRTLMEFAIAMQDVVEAFNKDLLEFNLILRIGFNIGDVTSGVIGTSKLHYDIWGDAVNVASRMDSTGVPDRIQAGVNCLPYLQDWYEFEPRGSVYVKGKDHMEVFLYKQRLAPMPCAELDIVTNRANEDQSDITYTATADNLLKPFSNDSVQDGLSGAFSQKEVKNLGSYGVDTMNETTSML